MNSKNFLLAFFLVALLSSCKEEVRDEVVVRPVKVAPVEILGFISKSFSGVVLPDQYSDLAFKVSGPLIKLNVTVGQNVKKGDIIAEIDPFDYRLRYEAAKSSHTIAKTQLERAKRLLSKNAISRQDYETTQAKFDNTKAEYENCADLLENTKLYAPFSGFVQKKYVENYQKIQQGTAIICLIDPMLLEIKFTMPESNMSLFLNDPTITVEFENYKNIQFKARVKEYVKASTDGSGLPVYLSITDPNFNLDDYNISVGFTCKINMTYRSNELNNLYTVPLSAIVTVPNSEAKHVFVYNPTTSKVELRTITDYTVAGRDLVVASTGVKEGEMVVVAGCHRLIDGQEVKVLTK